VDERGHDLVMDAAADSDVVVVADSDVVVVADAGEPKKS
jgi:hypothetical protein